MKTALNCSLILCLAFGFLASPTPIQAAISPPVDFQMVDGAPLTLVDTPPAQTPRAVSAGPYYLTLSGLEFYPVTSNMTYNTSSDGGLYAVELDPGGFGFSASYHLPSGTTVTAITFYFRDVSTEEIRLGAYAFEPAMNTSGLLSEEFTSGISGSIREIDLVDGLPFTIDNSQYAYRLRAQFYEAGTTLILYGARIQYTLPDTLPAVDYYTLAGADMRSEHSLQTYTASGGGSVYATTYVPGYGFIHRVDLPQGAHIDSVDWYVVDNNPGAITSQLSRHTLSENTVTLTGYESTVGDDPSTSIRTLSDDVSETVDNIENSYSIGFYPSAASSSLRFVGARVHYTPPADTHRVSLAKSYSGVHFFPSGSDLTYRANIMSIQGLELGTSKFLLSYRLPPNSRIDRITLFYVDASELEIGYTFRDYLPATATYIDRMWVYTLVNTPTMRASFLDDLGWVTTDATVNRLEVRLMEAGGAQRLVGVTVEYSLPMLFMPLVVK
jgi:hypothetical protein